VEFDRAFAASLSGERWKSRFNAMDEHGRVEMAYADDSGLGWSRSERLRICFVNKSDALRTLQTL
jgi:hypothetical protein